MAGFAVPVSIAALSPALAQTSQMPQVLPVTVVSAARYEQPIEDVVADITVIDRAEIERYGAGTINELLSRLPGVQSLGVGSNRIFIRGAQANMTAIYVDGIRFATHDKGSGNPPLSLLDLAHVQRIELLRGPVGGLYGSSAMGGVIQIFTDGGSVGKSAHIGLGSNGLKRVGLGISGDVDPQLGYRIGLQREISDGYATELVRTSSSPSMPWRNGGLNLGLDLKLASGNKVSYVLNAQARDAESNPRWNTTQNTRQQSSAVMSGVRWQSQWSDNAQTQVALSTTRIGVQGNLPERYHTRLWDLSGSLQYKLSTGTLSVGLERKLDALNSDLDTDNAAIQKMRSQNAAMLGWSGKMGKASAQINLRQDDDEIFGAHTSGGVMFAYDLSQSWSIGTGVSTGFKAPTVEQLYGTYGSVALSPERSLSKELRLRYTNGSSSAQAVLHRNDFRDMIQGQQSNTNCAGLMFCYSNVQRAAVEGLSLGGKTTVGVVTFAASWDGLRARNAVTGKPLDYRADEVANLDVSGPIGGWNVGGQWQAVGERYRYSGTSKLDGYALLNLHATKAINKNWTLQARLDNAADRDYSGDGDSVPPGRLWFVGLRWQGQ